MMYPHSNESASPSRFCGFATGAGVCNEIDMFRKRKGSESDAEPRVMEAEMLTAKELNSLSLEDRERVFEDIHGVSDVVEENPEFVNNALCELDKNIGTVRIDRSAYDRALFLRPKLVKDRDFRLMFLRGDCFDAAKAAKRIIRHFDSKQKLFGEEALVESIKLKHLKKEDVDAMESGGMQFLRSKDRTGRTVCFFYVKHAKFETWQNQLRMVWYQFMAALENDESAQKKGIVVVHYYIGAGSQDRKNLDIMRHAPMLIEAIPYRIVGVHFCFDEPILRPFLSFVQHALGKEIRLRFRAHYGSDLECQYKLMTYGIPKMILPIDSDGRLKKAEFLAYMQDHRMVEEAQSQRDVAQYGISVRSRDVLLGKGKNYQEHPANIGLTHIIDRKRTIYQGASRFDKTCISMGIVKVVTDCNGRFLKRDTKYSDEWKEVSDMVAREAISHRLRNKVSPHQMLHQQFVSGGIDDVQIFLAAVTGGVHAAVSEEEEEKEATSKRPKFRS